MIFWGGQQYGRQLLQKTPQNRKVKGAYNLTRITSRNDQCTYKKLSIYNYSIEKFETVNSVIKNSI